MKSKLFLLLTLLLIPLAILQAQFDPPYTTVALDVSPDGTTLLLSGGVGDCSGKGGYELRFFNIGQNVINRWLRGFTCGHVGQYSPDGQFHVTIYQAIHAEHVAVAVGIAAEK